MDSTIAEGLGPDDPREIGPFTIIGLLGTGGMGEVYLGTSETGYVAVKRVRPRLVSVERFQREVGLLYRVPEGVGPGVLASDSTASRPWFAAEYVPGLTVDEAVRLRGPLPADALWLLLAGIATRLRAVHEAGIVHRDLKPANVMIVRDGVKLIDFGIARAVDQARLTRTGGSYGTRGFTAPEQENGDEAVGAAADVYSLAALLLYAASGRTPGLVPDIEPMRSVDVDLATVIESCLAADPAARPTAASLADSARAHLAAADGDADADASASADASTAAWPPELTERIATRFAFAATPVSRMETLPPPDLDPTDESASGSEAVPAQAPTATDVAASTPAAAPSAAFSSAATTSSSIDPTRKSHRPSRRRTLLFLPGAAVLVIAGITAFVLMPSSSTPSHLTGQSTGTTTNATSSATGPTQTSTTTASPSSTTSPSAHASGASPDTEGTTSLPGGGTGTTAASSGGVTTATSGSAPGVHPTSSSVTGVSGGDDKTKVPGSEADTDWVGNDAACSAWLDDDGSGGLAGVLNTSLTQSCVAELYRSDGVHYTFSASWGAQKTNFIPVAGDTMWICVWHADDQSADEVCSPRFAMSGTTPVKQ
jgi:serine/threonine protein kinase